LQRIAQLTIQRFFANEWQKVFGDVALIAVAAVGTAKDILGQASHWVIHQVTLPLTLAQGKQS
jgi:hypothetical protein